MQSPKLRAQFEKVSLNTGSQANEIQIGIRRLAYFLSLFLSFWGVIPL